MIFPEDLTTQAAAVLEAARNGKLRLATGESCTGGLVAACLTEIPGSSDVFERGFITYSYESKTDLLQVPKELIESCGAVSAEVAETMAQGVLHNARADISVAVTGIAGPGGGLPGKPVGLVWFAIANRTTGETRSCKETFSGTRTDVRLQTVRKALSLFQEAVSIATV